MGVEPVIVLALDTATPAVTAGVVRRDDAGVRLMAQRVTIDARAHAETLTPNAWMLLVNAAYRLITANETGLSGAIMAPRTEKELVTSASTINTFVEPPSRLATIGRHGTAPPPPVVTRPTVGRPRRIQDTIAARGDRAACEIRSATAPG